MIPSLLMSGVLALAAAAVYAFVARTLGSRKVQPSHRLPLRLFALWWLSVAVNLALTGVATLAASARVDDLALFVAQAYLERLVLAAGLWALLAYIGFLLTGDRRTWLPFAVYYVGY